MAQGWGLRYWQKGNFSEGDAAYIAESARVEKSRKRDKVWPKLEGEARNWMRLTMRDGTSMDFRREQP